MTVEKIGPVTVYTRGRTYYLDYRQGGATHRQRVDGNLAAARATAHKVGDALTEGRPSPLAFARTTLGKLVAPRTQDRYKVGGSSSC